MDVSHLSFNKSHKQQANARNAISGLRWILVACMAAGLSVGIAVAMTATAGVGTVTIIVCLVLSVMAVGCGTYGGYLTATALGWSSFVTGAMVLCAILPLLKYVCFAVLAVQALTKIRAAGYLFTPIGPLRSANA
ncbi:hypothetical protein ADT25_01310 [Xanthomonas oryzae]|uniref:Uncharacterized protein n=2 Tax=Xanthomonas oryzae TaxID=347 RepID=A0AAP0ZNX4_9XANT|nr:hypothetical protein [Xanthomonas oryzae]KOR49901.1 hypothetical protein ADT25_01310 [Xanthomonas oryzae]QBG85415.1 hypothetical protein EYR27_18330 [Xanthomonas oryzae]